jgi:electron transfer flavoprotein alpha subunit
MSEPKLRSDRVPPNDPTQTRQSTTGDTSHGGDTADRGDQTAASGTVDRGDTAEHRGSGGVVEASGDEGGDLHGRAVARPLRLAALVKQIPAFESMTLGADGRLVRDGLPLEMSAYCRRAVAEAVRLARQSGGSVVVVTLGPPAAEDVLREAIVYGDNEGVPVTGVLVTDPAFAGSDTLATARALAAAIRRLESAAEVPFDVVFAGRNSVDADTGQVPPQLAQLLDRAFATGVKRLTVADADARTVDVGLELDDEWVEATVTLPAVLTAAERLIDPCKIKDPSVWATVDADRIDRVGAADLGVGPWGQAASPTWVGETRTEVVDRAGTVLSGPVADQVEAALAVLAERGVLVAGRRHDQRGEPVPDTGGDGPIVAVVVEPGRERLARELMSTASRLANEIDGRVVALGPEVGTAARAGTATPSGTGVEGEAGAGSGVADGVSVLDLATLAAWGADALVPLHGVGDDGRVDRNGEDAAVGGDDPGALVEEDVATGVAEWVMLAGDEVWAVLVGGTPWGREVASRVAAVLDAGLTGDAVGLAVDGGRLLAWKPAFGGTMVAAVRASSPVQLATVRAGVLPVFEPRAVDPDRVIPVHPLAVAPRGRVVVHERRREDDADALSRAEMVVGVGQGVDPSRYGELDGLLAVLGAELAATRKVTDHGWLPHARQLGITGRSISPRLYVALGTSGTYNHTVGVRSAGAVLAVNPDAEAPVFAMADVGIVGDWAEVVPLLTRRLAEVMT